MSGINLGKSGGKTIGKIGAGFGKTIGRGVPALGQTIGKGGAGLGKAIGRGGAGFGKTIGNVASGKAGENAGRKMGQLGTRVGKAIAKKTLDRGIDVVDKFGGPVGFVAGEAVKRHKREALIIILIASALPLLFIFWFVLGDSVDIAQQQQQQNNPLQITKTGPAQAKEGDTLNYTIEVTYPGNAKDAVISDPLPQGTAYVSSSPNGSLNGSTVTWDAAKLNLPLNNPINITVNLTLKATQNNTNIVNIASVTITGGSLDTGGNVPPNNDTCGGKYTLNSPFKNFGDPQCNFTKQQMGQEMKQMDSANYYIWDCMASHESGYNPNAYNPGSTSGFGAYGLLQMNPKGKGNGSYDNGTVNYPLQVSNAINYNNKVIGKSFAYWATYAGCH